MDLLVNCVSCGRPNRLAPERLADAGNCGACGTPLPPLGAPVEIDRAEDLQRFLQTSALPILVDFWAPWCKPCRAFAPEIRRVAAHGAGRLLVVKTNIDADPMVSQIHRIMSVPTIGLFDQGGEIGRQVGALPAPQIEAWIDGSLRAGSLSG